MSWTKQKALDTIRETGLIPIIRTPSAAEASLAAEAVLHAGIGIVEITMTVPNAIRVLETVAAEHGGRVLIGAGTVLDPETCRAAILAGAELIVTPTVSAQVVEMSHRYGKACICGALTPTEALAAWQTGSDLVKIFPCGPAGGPAYIKALKGPLPQIEFVPTGGVTLENVAAYFKAGATAVAAGSELVSLEALKQAKPEVISQTVRKFQEAVRLGKGGS